MKKLTTEEFIEKAKAIHGDKYDYSKVVYKTSREKVIIICPKHGEFLQSPNCHLNGAGCAKCCNNTKKTTETFIENAMAIHGEKYDYSKVEYINNKIPVCIICPEHGEFYQTPKNHLALKQGCPKCGIEERAKKSTKTTEQFIDEANKVHKSKYDYTKTEYIGATVPTTIICPIHGEFQQTPSLHLTGCGCPKCGRIKSNEAKTLSLEEFVEKAKAIHGDKYDYSKVKYLGYDIPVEIICKKHGSFYQTPDSHLQGKNCAKCSIGVSSPENELFEFCKSINSSTVQRERKIISPHEIDIFVKDKNIGIEYNGLLWHSEKFKKDKNYHLNKHIACSKCGVKLIQIFEDEFFNRKEIVLAKIRHIIGSDVGKTKIMGRKCSIYEIDKKEAKDFLEKYHIQGFSPSSIYLGALLSNKLIAVMSFKKCNKNREWELNRFASDYNCICQGVGGKMFNYFIKTYKPSLVKSFADRRWTTNEFENFYTKIGFDFEKFIPPDYRYYKRNGECKRVHKFNMRKKILSKKYGLPLDLTENEMTKLLDYYKIWDCGLIKYIWRAEK